MKPTLIEALTRPPQGYADTAALGKEMRRLCSLGLDSLPLPAGGDTLQRWQCLAAVAGHDLGLCKLYEGHTDALAIMQELRAQPVPEGSIWGTWASEPPQARVMVRREGDRAVLSGRKAWCSGAGVVTHGLLTAWDDDGQQQLVAVPMDQPNLCVTDDGWHAVGMANTGSVEILLENAEGWYVGPAGGYLSRPGFWLGGIGIAACWFGAARELARHLAQHCHARPEPHALAHLGAVDRALGACIAVLRQAANAADQQSDGPFEHSARLCRAVAEETAEIVISHVGRAMGAGPYCKDPHFARLIADLPVYLRQSHAERDLAALGQLLGAPTTRTWSL
ncbi:acyl-CoA dehydrogenase family protein [Pseudomonas coleopterorum]|uniref:acyl-CoA dehydrogenase family protein n=1 Tax=Pseudomonas coleopterorum TaxID=1605838 RepID=UPI001780D909|nr:acyl-CoA dehydrogenase family protein [Pseudomonas coleopterorum]MBD8479988.1 acyl-CoA dehydrogenase [Pseudomonas coleopterorum]